MPAAAGVGGGVLIGTALIFVEEESDKHSSIA
jgi:hypothetical protein